MTANKNADAVILKIQEIFNSTVETTKLLAAELTAILPAPVGNESEFSLEKISRSEVQEKILSSLHLNRYCSGAGFACHLESRHRRPTYWHLEWLYKKESSAKPVSLELDQSTQQHLDFSTFEWFRNARDSASGYIQGPYVDYICNTSLTLTSACPVFSGTHFVGVAALDILVSRIEEELLCLCSGKNIRLILTNAENRIFFSNLARFRVGEIFKDVQAKVLMTDTFFNAFTP